MKYIIENINRCYFRISFKPPSGTHMNSYLKTTFLVASFLLYSCTVQNSSMVKPHSDYADATVQTKDYCPILDALITEFDNGFDKIKAAQMSTQYSQIWQAKYHLVGNDCQVWASGTDKTTYACSRMTPNEDVAKMLFDKAKDTGRKCLTSDWQLNEQPRLNNTGYKAEFKNKNRTDDLTLSIHMVPSTGAFSSDWMVYYYVGSQRK